MSRSRRSARAAGARFERLIADYLAMVLDDDRVDRMPRRGVNDRGDIAGVRLHGKRIVLELKNCARLNLPEWVDEAHREAGNDDALCGAVISKRHGVGDPASQWVIMEVRDFVSMVTGETQDGCYGL